MIEFLTEEVRTLFHKLPLDRQQELIDLSIRYLQNGNKIVVNCIELLDNGSSEMDIRIVKQFDVD